MNETDFSNETYNATLECGVRADVEDIKWW